MSNVEVNSQVSDDHLLTFIIAGIDRFLDKEEAIPHFIELWESLPQRTGTLESMKRYGELIRRCTVRQVMSKTTVVPINATTIGDNTEDAKEIVSLMRNAMEFDKELTSRYFGKYSLYQSSWGLGEILKEEYSEVTDPGKIIGDYFRLLFTDAVSISDEYKAVSVIEHGSQLHNLLHEIGLACADIESLGSGSREYLKVALESILFPKRPTHVSDDKSLLELMEVVLSVSPDLFVAWAREWWLSYEDDENFAPKISPGVWKFMLNNLSLWCSEHNDSRYPLLAPELLSDLLYKVEEEGGIQYDAELETDFRKFFVEYSGVRKRKCFGTSLFSVGISSNIARELEYGGYNLDICDFTILLSSGSRSFGVTDLTPNEDNEDFEGKEPVYLALFAKAVDEGLPELGNALLSLSLIGRSIAGKGRFVCDGRLYTAIASGLDLPGAPTLRATLHILVKWSEDYFATDPIAQLSGRFFRQFLPKIAKIHVLEGSSKGKTNDSSSEDIDVKGRLIKQIGDDRWGRLSDASQKYLLSAENMRLKSLPEFYAGIKDFSGLVTNYCKVLEKELADRLGALVNSESFVVYHRGKTGSEPSKNPTLGVSIRVLMAYNSMPDSIKVALDNLNISLQHDRELLKALQKLCDLRNHALHNKKFTSLDFAKFMQVYFADDVLARFIDGLDNQSLK